MSSSICPACCHDGRRGFGIKNAHALYVCVLCGTIYTDADRRAEDLRELYDHYYDVARFDLPTAAAQTLDGLVRSCKPYRQTGRWLDIGYGEGGLLRIVESHGWDCYGIEVSPRALAFGQERGWTVAAVSDDTRLKEEGFDVITMIEFIEHISAPRQALTSLARLLRPGGLLYLTTPNAASINGRLLGARWSVFSPPEHLTIWTAQGLTAALKQAGFAVSRVRTEGLNPGEVINQVHRLARVGPSRKEAAHTPSRNERAFALNSAMSSSRSRRALKRGINEILSALGIGDSLKVWAVKCNLKL